MTQIPASMRLMGTTSDSDKDQRHDNQTQQRNAVQARLGERGADIAVRKGCADNHHRHRGIDRADGGQCAFHRRGQTPSGQTEEQRDERGNDAGVDQLLKVDAPVAVEQHDAVGEHEKIKHEQEHRQHRNALYAVESLNNRDAHKRQIGEHEQQLVKIALLNRRRNDAHEESSQRNHQRKKRDAYAERGDHVAGRASALQNRRDNAAGERRA